MLKTFRYFTITAVVLAAASVAAVADNQGGTVVDVAVKNGNFKTLVAAVKAAGLAEALSGKGPFTVFAPTDEAFAKLPKGTVESLLKPENKGKLQAILKYHVVSGKVMAADVAKLDSGAKVPTLQGTKFTVSKRGGNIYVDKAKVTATDVKASNGVIHVIDSVILPATDKAAEAKPSGGACCSGKSKG